MESKRIEKLRLDHPPEPEELGSGRSPKRGRVWTLLAVVAIAAVGVFPWLRSKGEREASAASKAAPSPVETSAPALAQPSAFTAAGYLEPIPPYPITVSTLVAGRIDEFGVLEGTTVKAGDVLAKLNPVTQDMRLAELDAEIAVTGAKLAQAEQVLARTEKLASIGSVAAKELERAKAEVAVARAEQKRLQVSRDTVQWERENTVVRAPVDGVVFERVAQVGEFVSPASTHKNGAAIVTIYDPAKVQVWADVTQRDAGRVKLGQRVDISIDAEPGRSFAGRVIRIQPRASLQKNTVQVKVAIEEPSSMLRPDMSAKLSFHAVERATKTP